jgi:hypothetical protein
MLLTSAAKIKFISGLLVESDRIPAQTTLNEKENVMASSICVALGVAGARLYFLSLC